MKKEDLIVGRQVRFTGTASGGEWPPKNSVLSITKVDGVQIYLDTLSRWFHRGWFTGDEGGCDTLFERYYPSVMIEKTKDGFAIFRPSTFTLGQKVRIIAGSYQGNMVHDFNGCISSDYNKNHEFVVKDRQNNKLGNWYLADYGNWIHENGLEAVIAPAKVDDNSDIANGWFPTSLKNTVIRPEEQNLFTNPYWTNTLRGINSLIVPYPLKSDQSTFIQTAVSLRKKRISKHKLIKQ